MTDKPAARERIADLSPDLRAETLARLRAAVPEAFSEGQLDLDRLKALVGGAVEAGDERYTFSWAGRREAMAMLQAPTAATLRPDRANSVNFDTAQHVFIEGENLEVLKVLYRSYFGRVKLIYIDPPYNTGNDFIYPDDFADPLDHYLRITGQKNGNGDYLTSMPDRSGRIHSAWLSMMYPRLVLARQMLREDGFIFVSSDDNEFQNLRRMMDEIFGEENFASTIIIQSNKRGQTYKDIAKTHEYLLAYSRTDTAHLFQLPKADGALPFEDKNGHFDLWELRNRNPKFGKFNRPNLFFPIYVSQVLTDDLGYSKISLEKTNQFTIEVFPRNSEGGDSCWRWSSGKIANTDITSGDAVLVARRRRDGDWNVYEKSRKQTTAPKSIWDSVDVINEQGTMELAKLGLSGLFDHPKPLGLLDKILRITTEDGDIILDFFAGSGTTLHAVMALNLEEGASRQVISVQLPELISPEHPARRAGYRNVAELCRARIKKAIAVVGADPNSGVRSFKLGPSTTRRWSGIAEKEADSYLAQMEVFADALTPGWQPEDVIWEVALRDGYSLNSKIEELPTTASKIWRVTDPERMQSFVICLETAINREDVAKLGLTREDIFVCLDAALNDTLASNLALQCRLKVL
ncbi:MAG TPA: site-specific DNA-methyltransferase [Acetobacteraceae bacterium]|nr:site-specific DNA-methyltransferase [Acetobacteraceae bacterium]